jgi:hypothetical protein
MIKDKNSLWWFPNAILSQQIMEKEKLDEVAEKSQQQQLLVT